MSFVDTDGASRRRTALLGLVAAVVLLSLPFVIEPIAATEILILAIFALGFNVLLGYGQQLSFGHAMFYGGGAYAMVMLINIMELNVYVSALLALVILGVFAAVVGYLSLQQRGVYFAMITLAFGQMVYFLAFAFPEYSGGSNGEYLPASAPTAIGPFDPTQSVTTLYMTILVLFVVVVGVLYRLINSPFGRALVAAGRNEERAKHLGYNTNAILLLGFVVSGIISAFAGVLYVLLFAFVSPDVLFWTTSGEVLLVTILGGMGTLSGPLLGAILFGLMDTYLVDFTRNWPIIFGSLFIVVVIFLPDGLQSLPGKFSRENLGEMRERFRR